jgi:2-polyprenyl-6-methoxyphenol hydroxylase-like FAD-dependent oxidoreductase
VRLHNSYDVIVAGGGPVGYFLAAELRRFGRTVVVAERLTEPSLTIKAGSVGAPSAEIFDQRGLIEQFPQPDLSLFTGATATARPMGHFAGLWLLRGAPELRTMPVFAQQHEVETVLRRHAADLGVVSLTGAEVVDLAEVGEGVRVGVVVDGARRELQAQYLVGCDGGRSTVRKLAGFDFPGTGPTITGRQALVDLAEPTRLVKGWNRTDHGMIVFGPGPQRVLTVEFDGPPNDRHTPVDAAEIQESLRRVSGTDVTVTALHTGTRWSDNTRQAGDYRRGRVLLAGDAAHVHPPFGGQGLNLGFQDAVNLGWKLAATLAGWAPDGLLDTYTAERHPVAAAALENTRAQVALMRPDRQTGALRSLFAELLAFDDANQLVSRLMSGVDRPYEVGSDHLEAGRIGADRPVAGTRLYERLRIPGGLLVDGSRGACWSAIGSGWADRIQIVRSEPGTASLLIRPDGIVVWGTGGGGTGGTGDDESQPGEAALSEALMRWFGAVT